MNIIDAEPVNNKKRMVAILPYRKMSDTEEITFQKGDIFFVHNDLGDCPQVPVAMLHNSNPASRCTPACSATPVFAGEQGLVFSGTRLLCDLEESIDPNAVFPWFHRNLSKVAILTDAILAHTILTDTPWLHSALCTSPTSPTCLHIAQTCLDRPTCPTNDPYV